MYNNNNEQKEVFMSSKAKDRSLNEWFTEIKKGAIKLPRFQRYEAWDRHRVASLLKTIIHDLPLGITLVLEVDKEQFQSRYLKTAEPEDTTARVTEHLLDGQQRLTSLWRSLYNNYEDTTYLIYVPELDSYYEEPWADEWDVYIRSRYIKNGKLYPLWADIPAECLYRGCIPTDLLKPIDMANEIDIWIEQATHNFEPKEGEEDFMMKFKQYQAMKDKVKTIISQLRENIKHYNLPYLALPSETNKDTALQVFINMNTNSKPLSRYDVIVAEIEAVRGESLHDLQTNLDIAYPKVKRYEELNKLILNVSALLQDKLPNERGAIEMDKSIMLDNWDKLQDGLNKMANFIEGEGILDSSRLPTNAVLAVIATLFANLPEKGDVKGKADTVIKQYMWSSFFTDRYENSAATHAFSDYQELKNIMSALNNNEDIDINIVPVLNRERYPLADIEELLETKWPKRAIIRAKAILAVSTYLGALDFADGKSLSRDTIAERDYHHLYPDSLLKEADIESYLALNCALITDETNRNLIRRKDPSMYVDERIDWADEDTIHHRIQTHVIPVQELMNGDYAELEGEEKHRKLKQDFTDFLEERAKLIYSAVDLLVSGNFIDYSKIVERKNFIYS